MKQILTMLALSGFAAGAAVHAFAAAPLPAPGLDTLIYGQEDCKEGEKWNEETQKCEPSDG